MSAFGLGFLSLDIFAHVQPRLHVVQNKGAKGVGEGGDVHATKTMTSCLTIPRESLIPLEFIYGF